MAKEYVEVEKGIEEEIPTEPAEKKDFFETPKRLAKKAWRGLKENVVPFALGTAAGIAFTKGFSKGDPEITGPVDVSYETPDNSDSDEQ